MAQVSSVQCAGQREGCEVVEAATRAAPRSMPISNLDHVLLGQLDHPFILSSFHRHLLRVYVLVSHYKRVLARQSIFRRFYDNICP